MKNDFYKSLIALSFLVVWLCFISCDKQITIDADTWHKDLASIPLAIVNGSIIDGSGRPAFAGNIYISGDSIIHVGSHDESLNIDRIIDATGRIVSPGFIDLHAHGNPLSTPDFENFLAMGVTSIVLGQDGSSPKTKNLSSYFSKVDSQNLGVNILYFVGHGTIRNLAGIGVDTNPDDTHLTSMQSILREQLKLCFGLSTGLEYVPGLYANEKELTLLAQTVGSVNKIIMSHMRNEDDDALISSIEELANQGKHARVHIAHIKSVFGKGKDRAEEILSKIYDLRAQEIEITADIYPYMASYTGISIVFPTWSKTKAQFEIAKASRRSELETYLRNRVNLRNGPKATLLGSAPYKGMSLAAAAKSNNKPFEQFLIDDLGPQGGSAAYFVMDLNLQERLLVDSLVGICSDGSKTGNHPRGHGTFAKIIENYVVNDQKLNLIEAIRKMTSYPAQLLKITNRGKLQKGNKADIIVFSPECVRAKASYTKPHLLSEGFDYVIVNGQLARSDEGLRPKLNGKVVVPE